LICLAVIGYGLAGSVFHAPLIDSTPGMDVTAIVTANPQRRQQATRDYPHAVVFESAEDVFQSAELFDLVAVATPNRYHAPLAQAAMRAGIPVVVDLLGVGENLQDHLLARMSWHLKAKQPDLMILSEVNLFTHSRSGMENSSPNLQYMFAPFFFPDFGPLDAGITLVPVVAQPESRGSVRLRSGNPLDPPVIRPNYLSSDEDMQVLVYGLELGHELMSSRLLDPMRGEEVVPRPAYKTKQELDSYVRSSATTVWHPSCSCRMGRDEMAVVDSRLRVYGLDGLRIIDSSVMPKIVNANLQATVLMIGEKGADMILAGS